MSHLTSHLCVVDRSEMVYETGDAVSTRCRCRKTASEFKREATKRVDDKTDRHSRIRCIVYCIDGNVIVIVNCVLSYRSIIEIVRVTSNDGNKVQFTNPRHMGATRAIPPSKSLLAPCAQRTALVAPFRAPPSCGARAVARGASVGRGAGGAPRPPPPSAVTSASAMYCGRRMRQDALAAPRRPRPRRPLPGAPAAQDIGGREAPSREPLARRRPTAPSAHQGAWPQIAARSTPRRYEGV